MFDELFHVVFEHALPNDLRRHVDRRQHRDHNNDGDVAIHDRQASLVHKLLGLKLQQAHTQVSGEGDEDGVDEKEVACAEEERPFAHRQPVTRRAERRHEGGGDGHSRNDVAFPTGRERQDARRAAEKGDQHIVERGRGARQEFRLRLSEWGEQKIERGGEHTDHRGHTIVGQRAFEQLEIGSSHGQPHTDDRAHEGRNEHRADDHRRGIEVQPEAGDENGKDEHPKVRTAKSNPVADLLHGGCFVGFIGQGVEKSLGDSPNIVLRRVHCVVFSVMFSPQTDHHLTGLVSVLRSACCAPPTCNCKYTTFFRNCRLTTK